MFLVTLTAPGSREHYLPNGDLCPCTPAGGENVAWWNATSGRRWSDFVTYLRREVEVDVQYAKAAECQKRGAIHFHAMVRCSVDLVPLRRRLRAIAMAVGFGHSIDVEPVNGTRAASYCAKYVSKSADDRSGCPWLDVETGEVLGAMRVRTWTASRRWGVTMKDVLAAQADWAARGAGGVSADRPAPEAAALDSNGESSTASPADPGP